MIHDIHFRYSRNFKDANGTEFRTLYKAYGIKFVISVSGQARKFAPVPFFTNVGSGLALLSIVSLIKATCTSVWVHYTMHMYLFEYYKVALQEQKPNF